MDVNSKTPLKLPLISLNLLILLAHTSIFDISNRKLSKRLPHCAMPEAFERHFFVFYRIGVRFREP